MPARYAVNDRIIGVSEYDGNTNIVGVAGTILALEGEGRYAVEFDENIGGHDLEGRCANGFGWHTNGECLEPYQDPDAHLAPPMAYEEVMI